MTAIRTLLLLGSALTLSACDRAAAPGAEAPAPMASAATEPGPMTMAEPASAQARLAPVGDSGVAGDVVFFAEDLGVRVAGRLTGLAPGSIHGFHVHEFGDCSAPDASSAGGHFSPAGQPHGNRATSGPHHAGDMPNQVADESGEATVNEMIAGLEIGTGGDQDIVGKSVILHANADDYSTQPSGDAGGRIACGVIELLNAPEGEDMPAR